MNRFSVAAVAAALIQAAEKRSKKKHPAGWRPKAAEIPGHILQIAQERLRQDGQTAACLSAN